MVAKPAGASPSRPLLHSSEVPPPPKIDATSERWFKRLGFGGILLWGRGQGRAKEARGKARRQEEERKREKEDRKRTEKGKKKERKREKVTVWSRLFRNFVFALASLRITHRSHISKELKLKAERKDEGGRKNERNRMQREKKEAGGQIYLPRKKGDAFSFSGQASIPNPFSPKSFTSIDDQLVVGSSSTWSSSPFWATCESKKLTHTWPSLKYWNPKSNGCENQFTHDSMI